MFCFASPYDYNTAVNRYFNRIEKMESFSNQFKDRARELISSAENAKLNLPQTMRSNILGLSEVKTKDTVEQGISRNFPLARSMKVGELAKVAGTTVRSLHYYDEIGLLRPSLIEDSGHRRYNQKDVERLQQIMSIKSLGLPLEDIAHCLSGEIHVSKKVFTMHEASISENISDLKEKKIRLRFLLDKLNHEQSLTSKELMTLITEAQKVELSS
jgi:DNA-binding transcriptional MerR regulator